MSKDNRVDEEGDTLMGESKHHFDFTHSLRFRYWWWRPWSAGTRTGEPSGALEDPIKVFWIKCWPWVRIYELGSHEPFEYKPATRYFITLSRYFFLCLEVRYNSVHYYIIGNINSYAMLTRVSLTSYYSRFRWHPQPDKTISSTLKITSRRKKISDIFSERFLRTI